MGTAWRIRSLRRNRDRGKENGSGFREATDLRPEGKQV
jgi:hypothetical protein